MFGTDVRATRFDLDVARLGHLDAGLLEADPLRVGDRADAPSRQWPPSTVRPSASVTTTPSPARFDRCLRATSTSTRHAAALEDVLEHAAGVRVLAGQHLVAAGDERDLRAEVSCRRAGELGARDARADDDEVLGHARSSVVQLRPGEDALAVGLRARQHRAATAPADDHEGVGLDAVEVGASCRGRSRR